MPTKRAEQQQRRISSLNYVLMKVTTQDRFVMPIQVMKWESTMAVIFLC
jgi:hypothetical protein